MTTNCVRERGIDRICTDQTNASSGELHAAEARAILSELGGTPLRPGTEWDAETQARFADFQRSEGLVPTGELDDVSVTRLQRRFDQLVTERSVHAATAEIANKSPTADAHARVEHALQEAVHAAENLGHQFGHDAPIRERYVAEAKAWSRSIVGAFERGEITEGEAALLASRFRNSAMADARGGLSPAGAALSKLLKEEGLSLGALVERYASKTYGKAVKDLTVAEQNAICLKIAQKAGATNGVVNATSRLAPYAGKALTAVAVAVAFYEVAKAEDKVGESIKQGAAFVGFWAGAKVGAAVGTAVCGPAAPACAVIGGLAVGILGSLLAEEAASRGYQAIKG